MIKLPFLMLLVLLLLFLKINGMMIPQNLTQPRSKKGFIHALLQSIHQTDTNLTSFQKCQKYFLTFFCNCCHNNDDFDEEINVMDTQEYLLTEDHPLSENDLRRLRTTLAETDANKNSDLNSTCISCLNLYNKQYLTQYAHNDGSLPHYSTCHECEILHRNLNVGTVCAICRKPSRKRSCLYVRSRTFMRSRIFDGSAVSTVILSLAMTILSAFMVRNMESAGEFSLDENSLGEIVQANFFSPSLINIQGITGITWLWYFGVSLYFLWQTKQSASLLMDARGVSYLLAPIVIGFITNYSLEAASILTIIPTICFVLDMYFKGGTIVSRQFQKFNHQYPQIQCMKINYDHEPQERWAKFLLSFLTTFYYWDLMGTIALTAKPFETHDSCLIYDSLYMKDTVNIPQVVPLVFSAFLSFGFVIKIALDKHHRRPVFNFKEIFTFLFAILAILSPEIQCVIFSINTIVVGILAFMSSLMVLYCFLACFCGLGQD